MAKIELQNIAHSYNPQAVDKTYALEHHVGYRATLRGKTAF